MCAQGEQCLLEWVVGSISEFDGEPTTIEIADGGHGRIGPPGSATDDRWPTVSFAGRYPLAGFRVLATHPIILASIQHRFTIDTTEKL